MANWEKIFITNEWLISLLHKNSKTIKVIKEQAERNTRKRHEKIIHKNTEKCIKKDSNAFKN